MVEDILTAVGVPFRETQFTRAPASDYAVYMDSVEADGPDGVNRIFTHNITVELYTKKPEPGTEATLETELNARGLKWTKQSRYWVEGAQRYQTLYEFSHIEKI